MTHSRLIFPKKIPNSQPLIPIRVDLEAANCFGPNRAARVRAAVVARDPKFRDGTALNEALFFAEGTAVQVLHASRGALLDAAARLAGQPLEHVSASALGFLSAASAW